MLSLCPLLLYFPSAFFLLSSFALGLVEELSASPTSYISVEFVLIEVSFLVLEGVGRLSRVISSLSKRKR